MSIQVVDYGAVKQSIRDLTRIYKPDVKGVDRFVKEFVRKYNIMKGFEDELREIVLDELKQLQ